MKILEGLKKCLTVTYYVGYTTLAITDSLFKSIFNLHRDDAYYKQYPAYNIGDLVETDSHCLSRAADVLFGAATTIIPQKTVGWIIEKYIDKSRPGSLVIYRVLFPEGIFWISQTWIINKTI